MNKRHTDTGASDSQVMNAIKRKLGLSFRGICAILVLVCVHIFSAGVAVTVYKMTLERLDERVGVLETIHKKENGQ